MTNGLMNVGFETDGETRTRKIFMKRSSRDGEKLVVSRLFWTMEEYDLMEQLAEQGLTATAMTVYFTPVPRESALAAAMLRAGIQGRYARGFSKKPSNEELARWAQMQLDWEARQEGAFRLM